MCYKHPQELTIKFGNVCVMYIFCSSCITICIDDLSVGEQHGSIFLFSADILEVVNCRPSAFMICPWGLVGKAGSSAIRENTTCMLV